MPFVSTGIDADGNATGYDSASGIISTPDHPDPRRATPAEIAGYNQFFNSPDYINGARVAAEQAAADKDFNFGALINPAIMALTGGLFAGGLTGLLGAGGGGVPATGVGAGSFGAGSAEGLGGLFGGAGSGTALTGSALGLGANGLATGLGASLGGGAAAAGDWWSQLGLTAQDVGQAVNPWTTNPGIADLTGGVLNNAGSVASGLGLSNLPSLPPTPPGGDSGAPSNPGYNTTNFPADNPDIPNDYNTTNYPGSSLPPGAGSALTRFLNGTATPADYASLLGTVGSTALGVFGANQQASALANLAQQYQNFGAPSRGRYEASMTAGFNPTSIPGYQGALDSTSQSILSRLSTQGNPFGNPGGLIEANKQIVNGTAMPAIQNYQALNANTGFGSSMQLGGNLAAQGIGADRGITTALASGLGSLTQPPQPSLADLMRQLQGAGLNTGTALT